MSEDVTPYGGQKPDEAARTEELRAHIETLGYSQRQTADALEVDQRTLRYWAAAKPAPPLMAIYALRYLVSRHLAGETGAAAAGSMKGDERRSIVYKRFDEVADDES